LLSGFAIELRFPPQFKLLGEPAVQDALGTIATVAAERKSNLQKSPIKRAFPSHAIFDKTFTGRRVAGKTARRP
jgi:hypothetical protein